MALSAEAKEARNRYYRELRREKMKTAAGRKEIEAKAEAYWSRKAEQYREIDKANTQK